MHISSQRACLKTLPRRSFLKTAVRASIGQMSSVARYHLQQGAQLVIQEGDITEWQGDAVVNAGALPSSAWLLTISAGVTRLCGMQQTRVCLEVEALTVVRERVLQAPDQALPLVNSLQATFDCGPEQQACHWHSLPLPFAAIHTAAGPELLQACKRYPTIVSDRCPTGDARVTL